MFIRTRLHEVLGAEPRRIAVFRALMLGDLLCAVPAFRALRHAYPNVEITLIGLPWAHEFARRFSCYCDEFVAFPGFPGLPEHPADIHRFPTFLIESHRRRFDVLLQMHGSGSIVNPLVALLGARVSAGYYLPGQYCPDARTYFPYSDGESEVWRQLRLLGHLNVPLVGDSLEFPVLRSDRAELQTVTGSALTDREYVCIHPGARYASRRWSPERFAEVGDSLASLGYEVVITGTTLEAELVRVVSRNMAAPHRNLAGLTSIGTMAALLEGARLLVCNDTGVSHLAAALRVPSVVIVTGSNPARWAPGDRERHRVAMAPIDCRPCEHEMCPIGFPCSERVSATDVIDLATAVLKNRSEGPSVFTPITSVETASARS
jgi:ADP-heptose:LPS heptosyltransferase